MVLQRHFIRTNSLSVTSRLFLRTKLMTSRRRTFLFIYLFISSIYIAPLQETYSEALSALTSRNDVKCHNNKKIPSISKISHSEPETVISGDPSQTRRIIQRNPVNSFQMVWMFRVSGTGCVSRVERRQMTGLANTKRWRNWSSSLVEDDARVRPIVGHKVCTVEGICRLSVGSFERHQRQHPIELTPLTCVNRPSARCKQQTTAVKPHGLDGWARPCASRGV